MEEQLLKVIAEQLTRIADLMENQQKRDVVEKRKGIKVVKEAVKKRKNELLRTAADRKDSKPSRD
tara:strand:+ start:374 stop:568 length:195 start_codon:yes stop_codon:yes gene_type:complete